MPTIARIGGINIQIFADDHNPPHFHVVSSEDEALVAIATLKIIRGSLRRRDLELALDWARRNAEELERVWNSLNG